MERCFTKEGCRGDGAAWVGRSSQEVELRQDLLCELRNVSRFYRVSRGFFSATTHLVRALQEVNLQVKRGEVLGLVGESGCGKSTLARVMLGLEPPSLGKVFFRGSDLASLDSAGMKQFRRQVQMVFQDPGSSLNPRKTVFQTLKEPLEIHSLCTGSDIRKRVQELLGLVGLELSAVGSRYPHEFSGGQRQRICIARDLATNHELIIADGPTSALDVSVQAQIISILMELHRRKGISYLFISHDLPLVQFMCSRIAVMYLGYIVEILPRHLFGLGRSAKMDEIHPYTGYLMEAVPVPDPDFYVDRDGSGVTPGKEREIQDLDSSEPAFRQMDDGCVYAARCREASDLCFLKRPPLQEVSPGHFMACYRRGTSEESYF